MVEWVQSNVLATIGIAGGVAIILIVCLRFTCHRAKRVQLKKSVQNLGPDGSATMGGASAELPSAQSPQMTPARPAQAHNAGAARISVAAPPPVATMPRSSSLANPQVQRPRAATVTKAPTPIRPANNDDDEYAPVTSTFRINSNPGQPMQRGDSFLMNRSPSGLQRLSVATPPSVQTSNPNKRASYQPNADPGSRGTI